MERKNRLLKTLDWKRYVPPLVLLAAYAVLLIWLSQRNENSTDHAE